MVTLRWIRPIGLGLWLGAFAAKIVALLVSVCTEGQVGLDELNRKSSFPVLLANYIVEPLVLTIGFRVALNLAEMYSKTRDKEFAR